MRQWLSMMVLALSGTVALGTNDLYAGRTSSLRSEGQRNTGGRQDMTVPYLTSGRSAILSGTYVAPKIYASPTVDNAKAPGALPVFNLIYQGAKQGFGDRSNGAKPRDARERLSPYGP